jgi:multidrug efflux system membrane fusion protein
MRPALLLLVASVLALPALLASACRRSETVARLPPPRVRTYAVQPSPASALELRGSIVAAHRVRLGFKQAGVIASLAVDAGDRVTHAQVVGRLNDVDARALVRAAQAARDKAQRDAVRAERLSAQGAVASSARDDARSQLEAAEAQLAQAREALERTQLISPVNGTVVTRVAEPGEMVGSGNPVLVVDSSERLIARAGATERERTRLAQGRPVTLLLDDGSSRPGRITSLATTPNAEDGLYAVEVTPEGVRSALLPGALVRLRFERASAGSVVHIPLDALVHRQDRDYVFVVEAVSGKEDAIVHLRPIEVDRIEGTVLAVRSGLKEDDRIVAEGAYFLQDGKAVRVAE